MIKIIGTIDRLEENFAVIKLTTGQEIFWDKNNLPADCVAGDTLTFTIAKDEKTTQNNEQLAKDILNQILKPNE